MYGKLTSAAALLTFDALAIRGSLEPSDMRTFFVTLATSLTAYAIVGGAYLAVTSVRPRPRLSGRSPSDGIKWPNP